MDKRWFLLVLVGAFGDACSVDENATGDGGLDASSDATSDVAKDVATNDASSDVVAVDAPKEVGPTCDAGVACGSPTDCPATPTCVTRTCTSSCCGTTFAAVGTACTEDGGAFCNGAGQCVGCNQPSDCTAPSTLCMQRGCSTNNCVYTPAATGTPCNDDGGHYCDGTGLCVACNQAIDCPAPNTVCAQTTCNGNNCGTVFSLTGTPCNEDAGHFCDGTGVCVQCNQNIDCLLVDDAGTLTCVGHVCTP